MVRKHADSPRERERGCLPADWPAPANVRAFTTLRHGAGASKPPFDTFNLGNCATADGDDPGTVARNRAELVERFALPSPPRWLRQVHGVEVVRFVAPLPPLRTEGRVGEGCRLSTDVRSPATPSRPPPALAGGGEKPTADASVTSTPGTVLAILTADCLPVVFAAADGSEVAAAHAGWRGLAAGVLEATVAAMHAAPGDLVAWLGPAAGPAAYEVGAEVFAAFASVDARAETAFAATRPGHWRVDLYALARQRLAAAGVSRVHGGGLCTISDPQRFFSHRRDGRTGRIATLAWLL